MVLNHYKNSNGWCHYTYNPKFGDYKECECGHDYHRHFDGYDNNEAVGCKYGCYDFNVKQFNMMNEKEKRWIGVVILLLYGYS
jgi:hypothetical protein